MAIRYFSVSRATKPVFDRLSFVLIGVATPGDLIQDKQRTPFNVGRRVEVTDFTPVEAEPLAAGLGLATLEADQVMDWVMDWTGGHPYLTQQLCRALAERSAEDERMQGASWTQVGVTAVVADTFFGEMRERDNNLQFVQGMLIDPRQDTYEVLGTYQQIWQGRQPVRDEEQSLVKSHLKLSGVVRREENKTLRVRNRIYETVFDGAWVKENLPVNWRKRIQRLQGVIAASLLLLGVMLGFTAWALKERAQAAQERDRAEGLLAQVEEQKDIAQGEARNAKDALAKATEQEKIAEVQRKEAEASEKKAEERRKEAEAAGKAAEEQRNQAEESRKQAERAKLTEVEQRQLAEQRQQDAEQAQQAEIMARNAEIISRQNAESATRLAQEQQQISLSRQLAAQSDSLLRSRSSSLPTSLLLAVEANRRLLQVDQQKILSRGESDRVLRNYTLKAPEITRYNHDASVLAASFSPDRRLVATASQDNTARLWDSQSGKEISQLNHDRSVTSVSFSPDGQYVATVSQDNTARLWDSQSGKEISRLNHDRSVESVSFSPDSQRVATASLDSTARIWDSQSGAEIVQMDHKIPVTSVSFSPDGQ